jgi:hypothetical protein
VEQFEALAALETNLDRDPTSQNVYDEFVKKADDVAHNLKEHYKD